MSANFSSRSPETLISGYEEITSALLVEDAELAGRSLTKNISALRRHDHSKIYRSRVADLTDLRLRGASARKMEPSASVVRWFYQGRSSLEELILQLYFGHLSVSAVDSIMGLIWGRTDGAAILSKLASGITKRLDTWLRCPLKKPYRYSLFHEVNMRYRRPVAEKFTGLVVVGGIDRNHDCDIVDIAAVSIETPQSSEILASKLAENGSIYPTTIIADSSGTLTAAIRRCSPSCDVLSFYSEFERELTRGVAFPDRRWVSDLLGDLKKSSDRTEARALGYKILQLLKSSGYPSLSEAMDAKLAEHLDYYDHPKISRTDLSKLEKNIAATLCQVREQARIIGPIFDDQVLVWFAAAAFRRMARRVQSSNHLARTKG